MIDIVQFGKALDGLGYSFFSGVPCSFLKHLINLSINRFRYIGAANEGEAVAVAAGASLAGCKSVALMQNSGLTNALSPLTSLNFTFQIPLLGFVSLRGEPGLNDEPQHQLTGTVTEAMLDVARVEYAFLSQNTQDAIAQLTEADRAIMQNKVFFFIVRKNTFSEEPLVKTPTPNLRARLMQHSQFPYEPKTRLDVLSVISRFKDSDTLILASTGKIGRELFEIEDSPHQFYMVGSLGCISSMGLGLSLTLPDKKIIAIDGDGALLMRMGSLATNGFFAGNNLIHILIDNRAHDSTGGQPTVSGNVDFTAIAHACGYGRAVQINTFSELQDQLNLWKQTPVLTFLHVRVEKGSKKNLGRPTITPPQVKDRFMAFIDSGAGGYKQ